MGDVVREDFLKDLVILIQVLQMDDLSGQERPFWVVNLSSSPAWEVHRHFSLASPVVPRLSTDLLICPSAQHYDVQ